MFLVPLLAGVWYLLLAAGAATGKDFSTPFAIALAAAGCVMIAAAARMAVGKPSAVRAARYGAAMGLAVAAFPAALVLLAFASTGHVERLTLSSALLRWSAAGIIPAVLVLLACCTRPARQRRPRPWPRDAPDPPDTHRRGLPMRQGRLRARTGPDHSP
ncbi:hypothetical protein QCN29_34040 [Streptomyces sp. HNM0663]|uniref:Uncharacterized protein n=1 Tax=Streptomyces chengmaiensis TaxID=3040919 RepID=A0ABT6HYA8_9ACTN|nr:hypothetical protein [Streptomyces chengmaiensis]MDH2393697.1 hypothetical protein [Streptomyces chengmaiensis]